MRHAHKRLETIERAQRAHSVDAFEIIKENGFGKGLALLRAQGRDAEIAEILDMQAQALASVNAWHARTFGACAPDLSAGD